MLYFVTSNSNKIKNANDHLSKYKIDFVPRDLQLAEIQATIIEKISEAKAKQAFEKISLPLFVEDSGWNFTALRGFPGPYMSSICSWFSAEDFLNLLKPYKNREVMLHQAITYIDQDQLKTFSADTKGVVLTEPKGEGISADQIISLRDDGKSIAECKADGTKIVERMLVWNEFGDWLSKHPPGLAGP